MSTMTKTKATATMRLDSVTKGAVRYQEVDEHGNDLKMFDSNTLIGTQYVRQGKFRPFRSAGGEWPEYITITIEPGFNDAQKEA